MKNNQVELKGGYQPLTPGVPTDRQTGEGYFPYGSQVPVPMPPLPQGGSGASNCVVFNRDYFPDGPEGTPKRGTE